MGSGLRSRTGWLLVVCCVAQFMVILDLSIVNVALPSIQSSLGFSAADLQWVVNAYAITFAGFLMLGGRAADLSASARCSSPRWRCSPLASLAGGLAPDKNTLIVARGFQGFAGAFMAASSLAIITSSFAAGPARHRAIGLWGAMNGVGGAAGVAARRRPHRDAQLALDPADQPADRPRRRVRRFPRRPQPPPGAGRERLRPRQAPSF